MSSASPNLTSRGAPAPRPLSPHLQIYRMRINMAMSIVHRITGVGLYFGTVLLAAWLTAAAGPKGYFDLMSALMGSPLGLVVLVGYTWALIHHMLGGIRHFIWDTGRGFDLKVVDRLGWMTIIGSIVLTAAVWALGLHLRGAF